MSEEQLNAFLETIKVDSALQEMLKAAGDADAVVAIAKGAGFAISAEELLLRARAEISEKDLGAMAGGAGFNLNGFLGNTNCFTFPCYLECA